MAVVGESGRQLRSAAGNQALQHYLPFLDWLVHYRRSDLPGDLMAGLIVAIMLVPQGMAYAMLAGLPPEVGLYASIVPLLIYGLLGSSRTLAVGPVAIVSLLVATAIAPLANGDVTVYLSLALTLAFLVGIIQVAMGLMRIGFLVNFLSHPVLVGFTAAAAIVIGFSQVKHLLGISLRCQRQPLLVPGIVPRVAGANESDGRGDQTRNHRKRDECARHDRGSVPTDEFSKTIACRGRACADRFLLKVPSQILREIGG